MDTIAKISKETNYRKVYLSDLRAVLNIYQEKGEKLTTHFGLPLAIAEHSNDVIGFASAKLNELEEVEFAFYYKNDVGHSEIQPMLEKWTRSTFNTTFAHSPEGGQKLKQASQRLTEWLNKCF